MNTKIFLTVSALFLQGQFAFCGEADIYLKKAEKERDPKTKISYCTKAIKAESGSSAAYYMRGLVYYELKDYGQSLNDFNESVRLGLDSAALYFYRGMSFYRSGKFDEAIADLSKAVNRNPGYADAYYCRGLAYAKTEAFSEAIEDYSQALKITPGNGAVYYRRGAIYQKMENYKKALADYNEAVKLDARDPISRNARGYMYLKSAQWDKAKTDFERALKLEPNFPSAQFNLAAYYWTARKNKKEAMKYARQAFSGGFARFEEIYDAKQYGPVLKGFSDSREFKNLVSRYKSGAESE